MTTGKKYVISVAGPTATGKTELGIALAKHFHTEIISADSRQLYRRMQIGTAKPMAEELAEVKHHFIDFLDIDQAYSAGDFERDALNRIAILHQSHDVVIMVGGTGFYHRAVLDGFDDFPDVSSEIRAKWDARLNNEGIMALQRLLQEKDPSYASTADIENPRRLVRALSVIEAGGKRFSSYLGQPKKSRPFESYRFFLNYDREVLYDRINRRVNQMIEEGLIEEVKSLLPYRDTQAMQTVGYKELVRYFDGEWTREQAINKIKQHTRNYAKRQVTWFRNQGDWVEVNPPDIQGVLECLVP